MLSTFKTTLKYLGTLTRKLHPTWLHSKSLSSIYNYLPYWDGVCTSGQPTEAQLKLISENGYGTVINLAPHNAENALQDEASCLQALNVKYHHIPVNFASPSEESFQQFCQLMREKQNEKLWVHCAANMRVSAFMYRYRVQVLGCESSLAKEEMDKIWQPFGVWKSFVGKAEHNSL